MKEHYSQHPQAITSRTYTLTNDQAAENHRLASQKYRARNKASKIIKDSQFYNCVSHTRTDGLKARIRHHLTRGRDVSDIVVRERAQSSIVLKLIQEIKAETAT